MKLFITIMNFKWALIKHFSLQSTLSKLLLSIIRPRYDSLEI